MIRVIRDTVQFILVLEPDVPTTTPTPPISQIYLVTANRAIPETHPSNYHPPPTNQHPNQYLLPTAQYPNQSLPPTTQHSPEIGGPSQRAERNDEEHCPDDDEGEKAHEEHDDERDADASGTHVQDLSPRLCYIVYHVLQTKTI